MTTARIYNDPVVPVAASLDFDGHAIRLLLIGGKIVFVASDVGSALGYARPDTSIQKNVPPSQRRRVRIAAGHGGQRLTVLSVSGLRTLLDKSAMSAAPAFKAWLTDQRIDGLREELAEVVETPVNVRLFTAEAYKPGLPKVQQYAVTPTVARLQFNDVSIRVVPVAGVVWLVAQDVCQALGYRDAYAYHPLRDNRVAPEHTSKVRLSDAAGQSRSLLVHPDALPGWMESALRSRTPGPRKTLAPAFMAFMETVGTPFLAALEARSDTQQAA